MENAVFNGPSLNGLSYVLFAAGLEAFAGQFAVGLQRLFDSFLVLLQFVALLFQLLNEKE